MIFFGDSQDSFSVFLSVKSNTPKNISKLFNTLEMLIQRIINLTEEQMMSKPATELKVRDIVYGVVAPTLVALLIVGVSMISFPSLEGLKYPLLEAIVIVGVPMLIGLCWNQWAGGSAGFLLGGLYALYYSDQLYASQGTGDISLLGNMVSAMLIGYIAGALNDHSGSYRRLFIAAITSAIMGSLLVILVSHFSPILGEATLSGVLLTFLPRILVGVITPLIANAFLKHNQTKTINNVP